ncbi:AAA family ATPase [Dactylosporangium sp. CA-092794]|uniref:AAA family ATPase n=1 Tax=Dactylosporangium sp. CA-092794 TaxID=3239929 RepID=UPI003D89E931
MTGRRERESPVHPLRGRDAERAVLVGRLDALADGHGGVVVVEGVAGSGKSSLLAEAAALGCGRGLRVFSAAGQVAWLEVTMSVLLEALTATDRPPVDVAALRRLAERGESEFWLLQELSEGLEQATLEAPVIVVLDDLQWADTASVRAVGALARRLAADAVLWLLALRSGAPAPVRAVVDELRGLGADVVRLEPLDPRAVEEVARDVLGGAPDGRLGELLAGAHGRPLLLRELLHGLLDEDAVSVRDGRATLRGERTPLRFRESIRRQVDRLSDEARLAVELAAILGRTFTVEQIARMMDRRASGLLGPLREALDADLIVETGERFAFRHDLVREAIDESLPGPLRRALRKQAVDASLAEGAPAAEVAALVLQTAAPGDREGVELLRRAAAEIGRTSPSAAARLSRHAFGLTRPDDPGRGALLVETVTYLSHAGLSSEASALFDRCRDAALGPVDEAEIRDRLATTSLQYDPGVSAALCRRGLQLADLPADLRARLHTGLAIAHIIDGHQEAARAAADAAAAEAQDGRHPLSTSAVLIPKAVTVFQRCRWDAGLRTIDSSIRHRNEALATRSMALADAWKALMLNAIGRIDDAWRLADAGSRVARAEGQLANARVWATVRGRVHLHAGRLADARAEAEAVLAMSEELGVGGYLNDVATFILGEVALHTADPAATRTARYGAARMSAEAAPNRRRLGLWLRARLDEANGAGLAEAMADETVDGLFGGCVEVTTFAEHADVATLVRLLLAAGRRDRAEAAVARLEAEHRRHDDEPVVEAALCHARGTLRADPAQLLRAVELYAGDQRVLLRARVAEDAGASVAGADRPAGLALLDAALERWTAAGADRDAARVRRLLRGHGERRRPPARAPAGWGGLTESETKVVRLVARGRTNRQVADELFLSPHTVSSHLRHAFAKLGIRSRIELARLVAEAGAAGKDAS